jgi:hypothetical protein
MRDRRRRGGGGPGQPAAAPTGPNLGRRAEDHAGDQTFTS